jgi:hypothetical protein
MKSLLTFVACLCILQLLAGVAGLQARWIEDGIGVCREVNYQTGSKIAPDGSGGAIIVWHDYRDDTYYKVYAQKVDAYGDPQWAADGILVCTALYMQTEPEVVSDGSGGAVVAWKDYRSATSYDIYAQRIDGDGNLLWGAGGVAICTMLYDQDNHSMMPDGAGGAIITWRDIRNGSDYNIYAQSVDGSGSIQWGMNGVAICSASGNQQHAVLASDGAGGAIITWMDGRVAAPDIYAQRINSSGTVQWTPDGLAVCSAADFQYYPQIVSASSGGAIIVWEDWRAGTADIYAQKVNASGVFQWSANGIAVCSLADDQSTPRIVSAGTGGAIIAWSDRRSTSYCDIYAQRLDAYGYKQWIGSGLAICTEAQHQYIETVVSGGTGSAIIVWKDYRSASDYNLYAQKVDLYGILQWATGGVAVTTAAADQVAARAAADGAGGAIIAWDDARIGPYYDIFAQRIDADGYWGYPNPVIRSVRDVPQDQGGYVNIAWDASQYDPIGDITEYSIWRALDIGQAAMMMDGSAHVIASASEIPENITGPVLRMQLLAGQQFYWELIAVHPAYYIDNYSKIVPTAFDSTAASNEYHYFQIIAHTAASMTFWVSEPDSGYSVDNIDPCPPLALAGEQSFVPEGLTVTWAPNSEADLDCYRVYRGTSEGFVPGPGSLLASPCDTMLFDAGWTWSAGYWYKVSAVDVHGNESGYAVLGPEGVTGDDVPVVPRATYLDQNHPNPFNPATRIAFGLAVPGNVRLRIYDAAGRLVRVLVDGHRMGGCYEETWDGRDDAGRGVASGVYFYSLQAGAFNETRKMVLLR